MKSSPLTAPFGANLPALRAFLLDTVYPLGAVCRSCGRLSDGSPLCPDCSRRLRADGLLFRWESEEPEPGLTAYWMTPHTGVARTLVLRLKHRAEAWAADALADLILPLPAGFSFPAGTVVTWVAMPERRRRNRCVDHGRLLAEAVARRLGLPCRPLLVRRDTLHRNQVRLSRQQRQQNLKNAFLPLPGKKIDFPVLLVDDVLTTGTTVRRCAAALRSGGADQITVLTLTRATGNRGI